MLLVTKTDQIICSWTRNG